MAKKKSGTGRPPLVEVAREDYERTFGALLTAGQVKAAEQDEPQQEEPQQESQTDETEAPEGGE